MALGVLTSSKQTRPTSATRPCIKQCRHECAVATLDEEIVQNTCDFHKLYYEHMLLFILRTVLVYLLQAKRAYLSILRILSVESCTESSCLTEKKHGYQHDKYKSNTSVKPALQMQMQHCFSVVCQKQSQVTSTKRRLFSHGACTHSCAPASRFSGAVTVILARSASYPVVDKIRSSHNHDVYVLSQKIRTCRCAHSFLCSPQSFFWHCLEQ